MRTLLFLFSFLVFAHFVSAQTIAITQSGDTVLLNDDYTWRYKSVIKFTPNITIDEEVMEEDEPVALDEEMPPLPPPPGFDNGNEPSVPLTEEDSLEYDTVAYDDEVEEEEDYNVEEEDYEAMMEVEIPPLVKNNTKYKKPSSNNYLLRSQKIDVGVWLDAKNWKYGKSSINEDSEYSFKHKKGDLHGLLITERIEIPLESIVRIAVYNAQKVAKNFKINKAEYRTVNGKKMGYLEMEGVVMGMKVVYWGYYYSSKAGTVQFLCFTAKNLFTEYQEEAEAFLNGLVGL
ncbi:MAG: hypothetical protein SFW35_12315 [Chitinophagales bacterium]|nr:hypothetical protein [Chitinophagales bacterium]